MTAAKKLWQWFLKNARDLPWRSHGARDPYHVWLAEIMLQQTQVTTVIPYYEKFLRHYPTLKKLAAAPEEKVLADWAGLGYYSRARNLQACAKKLVTEYDGEWPRTAVELKKLPGIGDYTAAAIAALAFGGSVVALDGNVARVLARFGAVKNPMPAARPMLLAVGDELLYGPSHGGSAEALIELGALVCTPRDPRCDVCPLQKDCRANITQTTELFPIKLPKRAPKMQTVEILLLQNPAGDIAVTTRPPQGLFASMRALPHNSLGPHEKPDMIFARHAPRSRIAGHYRHQLTHITFDVTVRIARTKLAKGCEWLSPGLARKKLPTLFAKAIAHAQSPLGDDV
jgi:A/G-specific adenine glycosylase